MSCLLIKLTTEWGKIFLSRVSSSLTDNIPKWADDFLSEKDMTRDEIFFYLTEIWLKVLEILLKDCGNESFAKENWTSAAELHLT